MKILFYNPAPSQRRFVPFEAIKGSTLFRRPNYDALRLSYYSKGYDFYYYDEGIEEKPNISPDIIIINIPLNLARYVESSIAQWGDKPITVCYGIYATIFPEMAKKFSKVVVAGDIISIWGNILADFKKQKFADFYVAEGSDHFNVDRRFENRYGFTPSLSQLRTTFGCKCHLMQKDYCPENILYKEFRQWHPDKVVDEVSHIKRKIIFVLDDDFLWDIDHALMILEKSWRYKKMWILQTAADTIFDHPELLPILREDGVRIIYLKEDWLGTNLGNKINDKNFIKEKVHQVGLIHNKRIAVGCKLRLGFENETFSFYKSLLKFLINARIDLIELAVHTPMPKTDTYKKYLKNDQIVKDFTLYDQWMPVVRTPGIEPQALYSWMEWLRDRFYSWDSILLRNIIVSPQLGFHNTTFFYLIPNLSYRNNFLEKVGYPP